MRASFSFIGVQLINDEGKVEYYHLAIPNEIMHLGNDWSPVAANVTKIEITIHDVPVLSGRSNQ